MLKICKTFAVGNGEHQEDAMTVLVEFSSSFVVVRWTCSIPEIDFGFSFVEDTVLSSNLPCFRRRTFSRYLWIL